MRFNPGSTAIGMRLSTNVEVLRVGAILVVVAGHFWAEYSFLWMPSAVGLLIFSYSSAYFTRMRYRWPFDLRNYWSRKVWRLGVNLVVVDIFLFALFIIQGRSGIITWQTIVNLVGLNGFLNWLNIDNPSPFGAGTWFLTLLFAFYCAYPVVNRFWLVNADEGGGWIVTSVWIVGAYALERLFPYEHALWLTTCGFVLGVYAPMSTRGISYHYGLAALSVAVTTLVGLNLFFRVRELNFLLLLIVSYSLMYWFVGLQLPRCVYSIFSLLGDCILEIYIVHSFLVFRVFENRIASFLSYLFVTILTAKTLAILSGLLKRRINLLGTV